MVRRTKDETRVLLLEAGRELLRREGLPGAINIRLSDVLDEVNLTSGAAYNVWPSQDDFQEELALHLVENFSWSTRVVQQLLESAHEGASDPEALIREVSLAYYRLLIHEPDFYLALQFWAVRELDVELESAIRCGYVRLQRNLVEFFVKALAGFEVEIRPPYSIDDITVAVTALTEGMALRAKFDPAATRDGEVYAQTLVGLFAHFTMPQQPHSGSRNDFA